MIEIENCSSLNLPVAPNTLPLGNSHMPAMNCKRPPAKIAIPTTTFGVWIPRVLTLNIDSKNVVAAKENIPLQAKGCHGDASYNKLETWKGKTYAGPGLAIVDAYVFGSFIVNVGSFFPSSGWAAPLSPVMVMRTERRGREGQSPKRLFKM